MTEQFENDRPPDGLIRSEERLDVSTRRVPSRRVRLEKFVVTETRTVEVEVSHEEVRLVYLDISADRADSAGSPASPGSAGSPGSSGRPTTDLPPAAADASDTGRWLTVSEERIVVSKEVVPVERVRLQINTVTEQRNVTEDVRREEIRLEPAVSATTEATPPKPV